MTATTRIFRINILEGSRAIRALWSTIAEYYEIACEITAGAISSETDVNLMMCNSSINHTEVERILAETPRPPQLVFVCDYLERKYDDEDWVSFIVEPEDTAEIVDLLNRLTEEL